MLHNTFQVLTLEKKWSEIHHILRTSQLNSHAKAHSDASFLQAIRFTPLPIFLERESDPNETLRLKPIFKMNWRHGSENLSSKLISLKSPWSYLEVKNGSEFSESGGEGLPGTLQKQNYEWNVTSKCREVIHLKALWQTKHVCMCVSVDGGSGCFDSSDLD